jgi:hypothetical protein
MADPDEIQEGIAAGRNTVKVLPFPGVLSICIRP